MMEEEEYVFKRPLPFFHHQKYDYRNAYRLADLFSEEFIRALPFGSLQKTGAYSKHKKAMVHGIFGDFIGIMQDHMIETGDKFILPCQPFANMYFQEKPEEDIRRLLMQHGVYNDVDVIKSRGKIYEMVYYSAHRWLGPRKKRVVRIGWSKYKRVMKKVNEGQVYWKR